MNRALYLECSFGISGDMFVASLLDLGADQAYLMDILNHLPLGGFCVTVNRVKKSGVDACDFSVQLDKDHENHDHDMNYLHGAHHHEEHGEEEHDDHTKSHLHEAYGEQEHHHKHHHEHRGLPEIMQIIDAASMTANAKEIAKKIFLIIGEAEAKAHCTAIDQVHFHEVGAVDSIIDIIAAAVCIDNLGIKEVIVPQLNEGKGWVRCQHGILPVPVPAVANIVTEHRLPIHLMDYEGEFVTPTGAAIVAALLTSTVLPKQFTIEKIGLGAGKRTYEIPSLVRAMFITYGEETDQKNVMNLSKEDEIDEIYKLETNIDDCSGEALGYVMTRLLEAGARDVHYHSVYMKKNRPAYQLNVICNKEQISQMQQIIFEETTTIGIRRIKMERTILKRCIKEVEIEFGTVKVKECELPSETRYYPEYESVAALSRKYQISYLQMYQKIYEACNKMIDKK